MYKVSKQTSFDVTTFYRSFHGLLNCSVNVKYNHVFQLSLLFGNVLFRTL